MSRSVIVVYPRRHGGGLGDFLRCALSFYAFARRNDIPFYIDYSESGLLQNAFEQNVQHTPELEKQENITLYDRILPASDPYIQNLLNKILTIPARYNFRSNMFGFEPTEAILEVVDDFLKYKFVPSAATVQQIEDLRNVMNIKSDKYVSIHVRCGDNLMINYDNPSHSVDKRMHVNSETIGNLGAKLNVILEDVRNSHKIITHSDNEIMRNELSSVCCVIPMQSSIQHTAHENIENNAAHYISTVAEFFIMMKAELIIQVTYSGFSHWAAILGKKQFIYFNDDIHITTCRYGSKLN